jgi:serine/threonine-protein kinase HipA
LTRAQNAFCPRRHAVVRSLLPKLTHAYNPRGEWTYQHLLSVNGKSSGITRADLLAEADRFGVRRPQDALKDARAALDRWPEFAKQAGLGETETTVA